MADDTRTDSELDPTKDVEIDSAETGTESEKDFFGNSDSDDLTESGPEEDTELPAFPFDEPRSITLKNGTIHTFKIPTRNQEKRMNRIQRTIIVTSPAIVHGQNPRMIKVDYSKAQTAYYVNDN